MRSRWFGKISAAAAAVCLFGAAGVVSGDNYIQNTTATIGPMTSATVKAAPSGAPATRTTIGLGEQVNCSIDSSTWEDTDCNTTTGQIENDAIGDRVWASSSGGSISPSGVTQSNTATLTADFDPGIVVALVNVYDSRTKYNDDYVTRYIAFTKIKPSGETTRANGWNATHGGISLFESTLNPTSVNFGNISVTEQDGAGSADGCWFAGSAFASFNALTGGTWDVNDSNVWGDDNVGWFDAAITYYRTNPGGAVRAPCNTTLAQQMHVVEGSSGMYASGNLVLAIGAGTVSNSRNGVTMTKAYVP